MLYTGRDGLVAHECIIDLRKLTKDTAVTADDVAKRLIDYGLHAPTLSFPVAGTLMIEPTESEDLAELDRFCDAMIADPRTRSPGSPSGEYAADDNPLHQRPAHGRRPCWSRVEARLHPRRRPPTRWPRSGEKYWPPVRRIDQAYGDRNLVCSCPPPEAFED